MNVHDIGPLIGVVSTIIIALIAATWHLSMKIGDLRVEIATKIAEVHSEAAKIHAEATKNDVKVDTLWKWFERRRRVSIESPIARGIGVGQ